MDRKRLILIEPRNLLLKPTKEDTPKAITQRMCVENPAVAKLGPERVESFVFHQNSDFCAYSSSQAMKKTLGAIMPSAAQEETWGNIVDAYIKATADLTLNTALSDLLVEIKDQTNGSIMLGILANGFWFSTPIIKAALPKGLFDIFLQSGDLRCRKPWPQLYDLVESITSLSGEDILLLDTNYESVMEARKHGWRAELADANMDMDLVGSILDWFMIESGADQSEQQVAAPAQETEAPAAEPTPDKITPIPAPITLGAKPTDKSGETSSETPKNKPNP